ncbi:hypothetical protein ACLB9X_16640 [Streptomyces sp. 5K101]|uniref:hypothetical protein n=1 Tax=Streptomyces sp. 5K101 TaxID=3390037 RepID=UPI00397715CC
MVTLHIEHAITDLTTWKAAFDRHAEFRRRHGVRAYRVQQPVDNPAYVVVDLEFATAGEAERFRDALVADVWPSREKAPALIGTPVARVLDLVDEG